MQELQLMNDPFLLLPANLGELARAASRTIGPRPGMAGVYLEVCEDEYEAVATDGRQLALVRGRATADPLRFPPCEALTDLPPSEDKAVIPREQWQEAFRSAPKAGEVAVHLGKTGSVLCTADGEDENASRKPHIEGGFPDYRSVLPTKEPILRIQLDPDLLLNLVKLAHHFAPSAIDNRRVTLEVWAADRPITMKTGTAEQQFLGLLMPLWPEGNVSSRRD